MEERRRAFKLGAGWKSYSSSKEPRSSDHDVEDILHDIEFRRHSDGSRRFQQLDRERIFAKQQIKPKEAAVETR